MDDVVHVCQHMCHGASFEIRTRVHAQLEYHLHNSLLNVANSHALSLRVHQKLALRRQAILPALTNYMVTQNTVFTHNIHAS